MTHNQPMDYLIQKYFQLIATLQANFKDLLSKNNIIEQKFPILKNIFN